MNVAVSNTLSSPLASFALASSIASCVPATGATLPRSVNANYEGDHEVIVDGAFVESGDGFRSAPYFNLNIDGIELLDTAF